MFYDGTLQSGIGQAIQQQKLVVCFIQDEGATSKQWEDDWLRSGWLSSLLEQKAILLRLESGSTEAGFLSAFCKIDRAPTLVVIHNGKLQLQLGSETGQEEFVNRVRRVLGAAPIPGSAASVASTARAEDDLYGDDETAPVHTQTQTPPAPPASAPRAPAPRAPAPAPATTAATSNAKGKQRADTAPQAGIAASPATTTSAQQDARAALQKKKREDAEELARIKARIEQDKAERKAQASARKAERLASQSADTKPTSPPQGATSSPSTRGAHSPTVSLNIRLFDGRTIRSTFPRTATLQSDVRPWIDAEFAALAPDDANIQHRALPPYFFRHILAPQPSRELSAGDENHALGDVDLAPSATLVLVPVKGYSDAYAGPATNLLAGTRTGIVSGAFGLLASTVGYAGSVLGGLLGSGQPSSGQPSGQTVGGGGGGGSSTSGNNEREDAGIRVRTLADQRAREPGTQQFYNGNQSNVEPRPDDRG